MEEFGRIYIIRNTINNKVYIGQTIHSVKLRFSKHLTSARKGGDYVIGKAIRKYGEENFVFEKNLQFLDMPPAHPILFDYLNYSLLM